MADQTVGELFKAKAILEADVEAATQAYLADPTTGAHPLGDGFRLDLAAAVGDYKRAPELQDLSLNPGQRRGIVRTAILLARPVKG